MPDSHTENLLDLVPVPSQRIGTVFENGRIVLTTPRFSRSWMARLFLFGKKNEIRITLDKNGSLLWELIDGQNTVRDILDKLSYKNTEEENFTDRAFIFIQQLTAYGAIQLASPSTSRSTDG